MQNKITGRTLTLKFKDKPWGWISDIDEAQSWTSRLNLKVSSNLKAISNLKVETTHVDIPKQKLKKKRFFSKTLKGLRTYHKTKKQSGVAPIGMLLKCTRYTTVWRDPLFSYIS